LSLEFQRAEHTIVLSDIHLAEAEPPHPHNPLWKRFKRPAHFVDRTFRNFVGYLKNNVSGPVEMIFNGDIFDFDSFMRFPKSPDEVPVGENDPPFRLSWLERLRGMSSEEPKSRYKIRVILEDHSIFCEALREFVMAGNRAVFVIGNHDVELHWPSVRKEIVDALKLPAEAQGRVRFCEWFYISNRDTLIEHGNQYDGYSLASNPINPLIKKGRRTYVRIPFGNLAGKYVLNGMGLFNPHASSSYIRGSLKAYLVFFFKYIVRTQPFLMWTWFWSALVTMAYSVTEGLLPAMTDPLTIEARVKDIARRANATPEIVWSLKDMHAHAAIHNPFKILRELWLDRAIGFGLIVWVSFQFFSTLNVFVSISPLWGLVPLMVLMPLFVFYARSVESEADRMQEEAFRMSPMSARIAGVSRVVHGHTHREQHAWVQGIEVLNTGTWSAAYKDVECTQPYGRKCFAWIRPGGAGEARRSDLYEWTGETIVLVEPQESPGAAATPEPSKPTPERVAG
jgi:UDP-2,3-diacylglucosamine pyrophosphatase LpxH